MLQIAEGWTVNLPDDVTDKLWKRTDYTWPCTWFAPRCDGKEGSPFKTAYDVMNNWGANHGAISYGHIGADLITFCSMLRIPVCDAQRARRATSSARPAGMPSAWTRRAPTIAPARTTGRSIRSKSDLYISGANDIASFAPHML